MAPPRCPLLLVKKASEEDWKLIVLVWAQRAEPMLFSNVTRPLKLTNSKLRVTTALLYIKCTTPPTVLSSGMILFLEKEHESSAMLCSSELMPLWDAIPSAAPYWALFSIHSHWLI
jgi:hypothetical protein